MISFPNAKINLGLYITGKRPDGFHNIETAMVPCGPEDILEFIVSGRDELHCTGLETGACNGENLVMKAVRILRNEHAIPPLKIHLHKVIPTGAGLGGGSSDAAFMLKSLDAFFNLAIGPEDLKTYASALGSDCAFFIENRPALATGRGEILEPFPFPDRLFLVLANPGFPVSTKEAYAGIAPRVPELNIGNILSLDARQWKGRLENRFEENVFRLYPEIGGLKQKFYDSGAVYASMSGSGSSVFGLYKEESPAPGIPQNMIIYRGWL